jgi:MraZ protein
MVFYGEYEVSMTAGGRVALPKKIRDSIVDKKIVITKGFGTCLAGYDKSDWEKRALQLLNVSLLERDQIEKRRKLFSSAVELETDDQGRIVLPKHLQNFAEIKETVLVIGVGDHFELWEKRKWEIYLSDIQE